MMQRQAQNERPKSRRRKRVANCDISSPSAPSNSSILVPHNNRSFHILLIYLTLSGVLLSSSPPPSSSCGVVQAQEVEQDAEQPVHQSREGHEVVEEVPPYASANDTKDDDDDDVSAEEEAHLVSRDAFEHIDDDGPLSFRMRHELLHIEDKVRQSSNPEATLMKLADIHKVDAEKLVDLLVRNRRELEEARQTVVPVDKKAKNSELNALQRIGKSIRGLFTKHPRSTALATLTSVLTLVFSIIVMIGSG